MADLDALPPRHNDAYQVRNALGETSLFLNWGLWDDGTTTLDAASAALIDALGRLAGLDANAELLDVGFGFGDQLLQWGRVVRRADGVNICAEQVEVARRRLAEAGLTERVTVHQADAVALPFGDATYDAVTAVECAFHFRTRERFFAEARRVLRPGGRLVLADFIGLDDPKWSQRLAQSIAKSAWGFAPGSFCTPAEYREKLVGAGFSDVSVEIVTPRVIPPGMSYARRRLRDPDLRQRMTFSARTTSRAVLGLSRLLGDPLPGEYVLVRAVKPR